MFIESLKDDYVAELYKAVFMTTIQHHIMTQKFENAISKFKHTGPRLRYLLQDPNLYDKNAKFSSVMNFNIEGGSIFHGKAVFTTLAHFFKLFSSLSSQEKSIDFKNDKFIIYPFLKTFINDSYNDYLLFVIYVKSVHTLSVFSSKYPATLEASEISSAVSEIYYLTSCNDFFKQKLWQNYDKFMEHFEFLKLRAL